MEDLTLALRSALPINAIDQLILGPTDGLAIVWVDIQERPDLAVLANRLEQEDGQCICTWLYANVGQRDMIIGLRIVMCRPTRSVFHLAFKVERYIDQLLFFAQTGKIWVVPGLPPAHLVGMQGIDMQVFIDKVVDFAGQGLVVELKPDVVADLRHLLDEWKLIK